jgi:hypothetical protein
MSEPMAVAVVLAVVPLALLALRGLAQGQGWRHGKAFDMLMTRALYAGPGPSHRLARWARRRGVPVLPEVAEAFAHGAWGEHDRAAAMVVALPATPLGPALGNILVNMLISSGLYREAVQLAVRSPPEGRPPDPQSAALIEINRAEAEYNLGRWAEAEACLLPEDDRWDVTPLVRTGRRLQLAWIAAQAGRGAEALAWCEGTALADLPSAYRSELYYPRAAALGALGRWPEAEAIVHAGLAVKVRPASERNGLFLLARVAAGQGRLEEAEGLARRAAGHAWRGQGGDGLLLWGDLLDQLGRLEEARRAWRLAASRDPQSESARMAATRRP